MPPTAHPLLRRLVRRRRRRPHRAGLGGPRRRRLARGRLPITAYNLGVRGATSADVAARFEAETAARTRNSARATGSSSASALTTCSSRTTGCASRRRCRQDAAPAHRPRAGRAHGVFVVGPPPVGEPARTSASASCPTSSRTLPPTAACRSSRRRAACGERGLAQRGCRRRRLASRARAATQRWPSSCSPAAGRTGSSGSRAADAPDRRRPRGRCAGQKCVRARPELRHPSSASAPAGRGSRRARAAARRRCRCPRGARGSAARSAPRSRRPGGSSVSQASGPPAALANALRIASRSPSSRYWSTTDCQTTVSSPGRGSPRRSSSHAAALRRSTTTGGARRPPPRGRRARCARARRARRRTAASRRPSCVVASIGARSQPARSAICSRAAAAAGSSTGSPSHGSANSSGLTGSPSARAADDVAEALDVEVQPGARADLEQPDRQAVALGEPQQPAVERHAAARLVGLHGAARELADDVGVLGDRALRDRPGAVRRRVAAGARKEARELRAPPLSTR